MVDETQQRSYSAIAAIGNDEHTPRNTGDVRVLAATLAHEAAYLRGDERMLRREHC